MKLVGLGALLFGVATIAHPTASENDAPSKVKREPATVTSNDVTCYGPFCFPKIPSLPSNVPSFPVPPTSGNSTSADASLYPYLPNSANHRGNWLGPYNINTDFSTSWPTTGNTVKYTLTVTNQTLSPNGVPKQMLVVNGQYPGPTITANWGDYLEITVINKLTTNGTSMHWHGLRQLNTNPQDGVNGITECPIAPGDSKVYRFQATEYGTSWYHSHFSVQYGDGVAGPIVINGPSSANYDIDLGTVMVSDYYNLTSFQQDWITRRKGPQPFPNYLLNGQNIAVDGSTGQRAKFTFTPGKKHLLRLINTSVDALFKMSIDGHKLQVVQADFVPIVPYYTNEVAMTVGQRYHVIVTADQTPDNYYFRAMAATDCTVAVNDGTGTSNGIISYANAPSQSTLPTSSATNHTNTCVDEPLVSLTPLVPQSVPNSTFQSAVKTEDVGIQAVKTDTDFYFQWTLGGVSQVIDWGNPTLANAVAGNNTYSTQKNVVQLTSANTWTYWVIQNRFFVPHPMHLHGHDFSLLGQGQGVFDPSTDVSKLNFQNPPRRDVALLVASGWTVIAFKTDNPGAWLMHCHIAWHNGEGLSMQFLERPSDIPGQYKSTVQGSAFQNTCTNWNKYAKTAPIQQYDSGLKKRTLEDGSEVIDWTDSPYIKAREERYLEATKYAETRRRSNFVKAALRRGRSV